MKKILIANRGEIVSRIMRTAKKMNIETVVVYSEADEHLPYVKEADKAYCIGEPPSVKSYLNVEKIIEIAKTEKVCAIHPGYGFLSENPSFAKQIAEEGIKFIGPTPEVIEAMGDKMNARRAMEKAGVPIVPGTNDPIASLDEALHIANDIGYPVMLKASGGGGGIGMQCCHNDEDIRKAYTQTKNRAKAYFGNDELFIEKYISKARHIEVQILADHHGHVVHLFERNCSVQRRNQKVIEEAPSPNLSEETRKKLGDAAIAAAKEVGYTNAGTIEFVMDEHENFYFLEMNTRLQVEHPITESICQLDLVEWQIKIADDQILPFSNEQIVPLGHSIEFRLYAEDPMTFLPSPGEIKTFTYPQMDGVRIDSGYEAGNRVSHFYDPMVAKVIVTANSRHEVIEKAKAFFQEFQFEGIKHNVPLFQQILEDPQFIAGQYTTSFLANEKILK